jgi:hypothetical protein
MMQIYRKDLNTKEKKMKEIWKNIPGYEGLYQVSNLGNIKSLYRYQKILKPGIRKNGYLHITLCKNKQKKDELVHRIILKTFDGESNLDCNHKNGIKTDNRLKNLEYCTRQENIKHSYNNKLQIPIVGENCSYSKLTEKQVKQVKWIFKNVKVKYGYWGKLAKLWGVHPNTLSSVRNNHSWRHIEI